MAALTANGGTPAASPDQAPPVTIRNDNFWPDIDVVALRASTRLTGNVTDDRLRVSVVEAMIWANEQLLSFKARQIADGWEKAEDIGPTINGQTVLVHRYHRAVTSTVQADVAEKYRDWDTTRAGDFRADVEGAAADDFRRNATWAISDILQRGRTVVDLI